MGGVIDQNYGVPFGCTRDGMEISRLKAERDTLRAEVERLRGELTAAKEESTRKGKDFRTAIDNWVATANDYVERWKQATARAEAAEARYEILGQLCVATEVREREAIAHAMELRAALEDAVGDIDETIHFYRPEGWSSEDLSASKALLPVLKATLARNPAQCLASGQARTLREAAERISTIPERMGNAFGGVTREDVRREVLMMAERLEKESADAV